jgi:hypothetical protein
LKGTEEKPSGPKGGRAVFWKTPIKDLDLEKLFPVFVIGMREK